MKQFLSRKGPGRVWLSIVLMALAAGTISPAPAAADGSPLDSADYTFVYPNYPDQAVWALSVHGGVVVQTVDGLGLAMSDVSNDSRSLYIRPAPFLSGSANNPDFPITATFHVRAQVPYVSDGSGAWSAEAIGWRMIVDDGSSRLELALARSPSHVRQVRIENSTSIPPLDFPWDNDLANTYQIARLANGDFQITLTNADPSNSNPIATATIAAGLLPPSSGTPMFAWGMELEGGGLAYWLEAHAEVNGPPTTTLLDSAGYTFVYPNSPDPVTWSTWAGGSVTVQHLDGVGLGMADPDHASWLLYEHGAPTLGGDSNNPYFPTAATFRARVQVPPVSDGSNAWSAEAIGWRLIVDDGSHRLELALSREANYAREVRVQNSPIDPIPFPWDNGLPNTYEITRLTDGNFQITLINADLSSLNPITTVTALAAQIPSSSGVPLFAWGMGSEGGGMSFWLEVQARVFGPAMANQPPAVGAISAPLDPVPVNTLLSASAGFTDPDAAETHTAVWDWGDGTTSAGSVSEAGGAGMVSGEHAYPAAGVYPLTLTVADDQGAAASATFQYVVVYDPNGGFVTGGGWFDSPAGAYQPGPGLGGRATFGFVSRYQKGASVPTGDTEFRFHAGDLYFRSSSYEWLVVNQGGTNAQLKGSGTINGAGSYRFMLWATDGAPDSLRLKIWEEVDGVEVVVYDNGVEQALGGGSILVHKK